MTTIINMDNQIQYSVNKFRETIVYSLINCDLTTKSGLADICREVVINFWNTPEARRLAPVGSRNQAILWEGINVQILCIYLHKSTTTQYIYIC